MLSDCATELKVKATEAESAKSLVNKLQAQLDQADVENRLMKVRFERELQSKDTQLAAQAVESTLHVDTLKELAARLIQQQKEHTKVQAYEKRQVEALKVNHKEKLASLEREFGLKDLDIEGLHLNLEGQAARVKNHDANAAAKIA